MKNFIKKHYYIHLIVGVFIGWLLSQTFEGVPIFVQFFITAFVSTVIGIFWEWGWKMYNDSEIDYRDVFWTALGSVTYLTLITII